MLALLEADMKKLAKEIGASKGGNEKSLEEFM